MVVKRRPVAVLVVHVHSVRRVHELADVRQGHTSLGGHPLHERLELLPPHLQLSVRLDLLLRVQERLIRGGVPEVRRLQRGKLDLVELRLDRRLEVRDDLEAVAVLQLPADILALGVVSIDVADASHGPVAGRRPGFASEQALGHVGSESCLVLSQLLAVPSVDPALLQGPAKLHAVCGAVLAPIDHRRLLVLPDSLEPSDQLGIVEEIPSRCQVY